MRHMACLLSQAVLLALHPLSRMGKDAVAATITSPPASVYTHACVPLAPPCLVRPSRSLGKRVTIGSCSTVLPGAVLEDGCVLGDMSLVMKNDTVPAGSGGWNRMAWHAAAALLPPRWHAMA